MSIVALSPKIYVPDSKLAVIVKSWGWKVHKQKNRYIKNDLLIEPDAVDGRLWIMQFHGSDKQQKWALPPSQIKAALDHFITFTSKKNQKKNDGWDKKKRYLEQASLSMGKSNFPLSFWLELSNIQSVEELLGRLFALPVFINDAYLLLCVLKKGESQATIFDYSRGRSLKKMFLESEKFHAIFEHVKKNKKGYLYNMANLSSFLQVQGYVLGGVANSSKFQVVFLVSKNELIPPSEDEIDAMKSLLPELIPWIELALKQDEMAQVLDLLKYVSKLLPLLVEVKIDSKNIWQGHLRDLALELEHWSLRSIELLKSTPQNTSDDTYLDLYHYQRVRLLGELFNTLKHELSNPLFGLRLSNQILSFDDQQMHILWQNIELNISRCEQILDSILGLYGERKLNQSFDIKQVLNQALLLSKSKTKGVLIDTDFAEIPQLQGDPSLILHIVFNLLINAAEHLQYKRDKNPAFIGKIFLKAEAKDQYYEILVADNGDGVPGEIQSQLFHRFVSTKQQGTGLGLSLSTKLAAKLPGELVFAGNGLILHGAHFILRINR